MNLPRRSLSMVSVALLAGCVAGLLALFAIPLAPAAAASSPALSQQPQTRVQPGPRARLGEEIARVAAESHGAVGVAAIDLQTGETIEYNGADRFQMASTLKLPLAVYAMHLADAGRISLEAPIPVTREEMIEPGVLHEYFRHAGIAISLSNAIELSVTRSDNGATDVIYRRVGGPRAVNAWLRSRGYGDMNMGEQTVKETFSGTGAPVGAPSDNLARTVTPMTMARFLADLHQKKLVSAERTRTMLDIMSRTLGERIGLQLPPGATVLHKTGTLPGGDDNLAVDVGYMRFPSGRTIAIAVFISRSPGRVSHASRDRMIGSIARSIYDYFYLVGEHRQ
jgi:beta-lactamase class A